MADVPRHPEGARDVLSHDVIEVPLAPLTPPRLQDAMAALTARDPKMARAIDNAGGGTGGGGEDGYSASGTLTMGQTLTVLDFEYNADFTYTFTNSGPAMVMEANLLQDGAPVAAAAPIAVNMGMPVSGQLGTWGPVGNQIMLRNTDMTMSLGYSVTLELP